ncbi:hypothetical protein NDU88_002480 [Pleurodeles waltl]|uniref:Uncharacterized protein n=1 Tax=Pleurodeles waltl TaxID=8319 RepID=A0AAV7KUB1_PLEWA|nr:hypothetical protein NDU88_002480 [Pleurodeles waltl]
MKCPVRGGSPEQLMTYDGEGTETQANDVQIRWYLHGASDAGSSSEIKPAPQESMSPLMRALASEAVQERKRGGQLPRMPASPQREVMASRKYNMAISGGCMVELGPDW